MGPNKPLLTWTLCAQIPCSLCFFSLLVWMHYATQLQFSDSKMPVLVVQQLASLERIKHYTVSWQTQRPTFPGCQGSHSVHSSVWMKAGTENMTGTSDRPEHQRPWVCSSDCCGIKSMLLLVQREECLAKNFKEILHSGFGRNKGFHLMEIRTGEKKLLNPISSFSLGTHWRTDPGHVFFNSLYNLVLKLSKWWAGDPSLGRRFIFDQSCYHLSQF